jgi:hypothetical protein
MENEFELNGDYICSHNDEYNYSFFPFFTNERFIHYKGNVIVNDNNNPIDFWYDILNHKIIYKHKWIFGNKLEEYKNCPNYYVDDISHKKFHSIMKPLYSYPAIPTICQTALIPIVTILNQIFGNNVEIEFKASEFIF